MGSAVRTLEENGMKKMWLAGLALGASLALGRRGVRAGHHRRRRRPDDRRRGVVRRQMKNGAEQAVADINAAGGVLGKKLKLEVGDDACDPKQARSVGREVRRHEAAVRRRALLLVVVDPGVGGLCRGRRAADHAGLDQPDVHRAQPLEHVPRLRPRRPAGRGRRRLHRQELQGQERRRSSTTRPPTAKASPTRPRRRSTRPACKEKLYEAYNKGDKDFTALVSKLKRNDIDVVYVGGYHQEAGLILRQMRDQGLKTVLMAGDALADKEFASITGPAGEGVLFTFGPDPRKKPTAAGDRREVQGQEHRSGRLHALHLRRVPGLGAGRGQGRHHRCARRSPPRMKAGKWDTVLGKISFDKKGDITVLDYVVYKWDKNGNYAELPAKTGS